MPEAHAGLHLHASARLFRPGGLERVCQPAGYLLVLRCRRFGHDHVAVNHFDPAGNALRERVILDLAHRVRQPHVRQDAHRNLYSRCGAPSMAAIRCTSVSPAGRDRATRSFRFRLILPALTDECRLVRGELAIPVTWFATGSPFPSWCAECRYPRGEPPACS